VSGAPFDAALAAAQRAEAAANARQSEVDEIRKKGFTAWVRDTRIEKLKEELRKKVMAELGVSEDSIATLSSAIRQVLEEKIKAEVEKRLTQLQGNSDANSASDSSASSTSTGKEGSASARTTLLAAQEGSKPQDNPDPVFNPHDEDPSGKPGKSCPVIPALSMPGGASLF
jgi:hypothetical protein